MTDTNSNDTAPAETVALHSKKWFIDEGHRRAGTTQVPHGVEALHQPAADIEETVTPRDRDEDQPRSIKFKAPDDAKPYRNPKEASEDLDFSRRYRDGEELIKRGHSWQEAVQIVNGE